MLCGAAQNLEQIVIFRLIQGAAGAFLLPLSQTFLLDLYPPDKHAAAMTAWSMGSMIAPIMGPTVGGFLTEFYSWRWVFYINLPFGLISIAGIAFLAPETKRESQAAFDVTGFVFLSIAVGALQLMLDRGTTLDWFSSPEIVIEAILAALGLYIFVVQMMTAEHPFMHRALFTDRNYVVTMVIGFMVMTTTFATMALMPTMLQSVFGYPVLTAGFLLVPRGVGSLVGMGLAGHLLGRFDARAIIAAGLILVALSMWQIARFYFGVSEMTIMANGLLQGLGNGLTFVPLSTVMFASLSKNLRTEGSATFGLLRGLGGAIGVSTIATMLARLGQTNHADIVEHITPFNAALPLISPNILTQGPAAAAMLDSEINRQATMISYIDVFQALVYIIGGTALLLPFLRLSSGPTVIDKTEIVEA
jgi:DHA2 family multidrug resistance protein